MGINMLLTIGGIILLSTFILYANGLMLDNVQISEQNEYVLTAIALGQSIIDEAKTKAFDENIAILTEDTITTPASFTPVASLSYDGVGEQVMTPDVDTLTNTGYPKGSNSARRFDDVDDYNGYRRVVYTPRAKYQMGVDVNYASETFPDSSRASRTNCKKMTVTVTSPFIVNPRNEQIPIVLSYAFVH